MANSQSYKIEQQINSTLFLDHISELRRHISSNFDRKAKSRAHSDSEIIGFTTSLQMRKLETGYLFIFFMATKLQFFTC